MLSQYFSRLASLMTSNRLRFPTWASSKERAPQILVGWILIPVRYRHQRGGQRPPFEICGPHFMFSTRLLLASKIVLKCGPRCVFWPSCCEILTTDLSQSSVIPKNWKTVLATCPASCSTLMGECKGKRHVRCYHNRLVSGAGWVDMGVLRPLVTLKRVCKASTINFIFVSDPEYPDIFEPCA